jgi:hypothetical protein
VGWEVMILLFVCKNHVVEGLKVTKVPHIKKVANSSECKCSFCHDKAQFKLYHLF